MEKKDLFTDGRETLAVVDVGSNSVRMNIYEINTETGAFSVISSNRAMLKLAAYVSNGVLSPDGEGKLFALLREYLARANSVPCDDFAAFATASLRGLSNAEKIKERIKKRLGIELEIISGEKEASLDYEATLEHMGRAMAQRGIVIDMGGGSTELIAFDEGRVRHSYSLQIGSLALWKKFCGERKNEPFPTESERDDIRQYVLQEMKKAAPLKSFGGTAYIIGGTARAIARIDAHLSGRDDKLDGYTITDHRFSDVCTAVIDDSESGGKMIDAICAERITSIVPGVIAFSEIIKAGGVCRAVVSPSGVREGYVLEYIRRTFRKRIREI